MTLRLGRSDVACQRRESTSCISFMNYLSSSSLLLRIIAPEAVTLCYLEPHRPIKPCRHDDGVPSKFITDIPIPFVQFFYISLHIQDGTKMKVIIELQN